MGNYKNRPQARSQKVKSHKFTEKDQINEWTIAYVTNRFKEGAWQDKHQRCNILIMWLKNTPYLNNGDDGEIGIRQGDYISPLIFNLVMYEIMKILKKKMI